MLNVWELKKKKFLYNVTTIIVPHTCFSVLNEKSITWPKTTNSQANKCLVICLPHLNLESVRFFDAAPTVIKQSNSFIM